MANETPSVELTDEIITAVLDKYVQNTIVDQVALNTPVGNMMMTNPNNKGQDGGYRFRIGIRVGKTNGLNSFAMGDTLNPQRKPVLQYMWGTHKQALADVRIDWVEERMNAGNGKIFDILTERVAATMQDSKEDFQTMMWGDGTGNGGKDFMGITGLVPTDPTTGVIMGYDRSSAYWARPWYWNGSTYGPHPIDSSAGSVTGLGAFGSINTGVGAYGVPSIFTYLMTGWNSTQIGESPADCRWLSDQAVYEYYTVGYPMYANKAEIAYDEQVVNWGFGGAKFMNATWLFDTVANGAPSGELRLLNLKYLYMVKDTGAWWVWLPWRDAFNQLSRAKYLAVRGNDTCSNFRRQAIFTGITAWA